MAWHPDQVELVRSLAAEHLSAAEMGRRLGVTRNAIIGLCHRRGIALNDRKLRYTKTGKPIERKPPPPKPTTSVKAPIGPKVVIVPKIGAAPFTPRAADVVSQRIPLIELNPFHCRWPDDERDVKTGQHTFCGHIKRPGSSYCPAHTQLSIGVGTKSERRALRDAARTARRVA